jgi:hypothetical protein
VNFTGNPLNLDCPSKDVTVTNSGQADLTISEIVASGQFSETDTCPRAPAVLAPGASCMVSVKFYPVVVGPDAGTITITSDAPGSPHTITATGNGLPACQLLAKVRTARVLRGTDAQEFTVEDGKPSCSPVEFNLTCSVDNPAVCALSPAVIAPSGASTLRVSNLGAVGAESLSVRVKATSEFRAASEVVTVEFRDFAFTRAPETARVRAGETATYALAIRPVNGLSGDIALTCSGAPRGARCTLEPASVTLDGASLAQVQVRVTTAARATALPLGRHRGLPLLALLALLAVAAGSPLGRHRGLPLRLALLAVAAVYDRRWVSPLGRRRGLPLRLALAAALLAMLGWASCGGGGTSLHFTSGGTPAGSYTLTIRGTYTDAPGTTPSSLANQTSVTLLVE